MTDFNKTCTNTLNVFGTADNWNAWNWNAFIWGDGTADLEVKVLKILDNTITVTDTDVIKIFTKLALNTITVTDADVIKIIVKLAANTLTPTNDVASPVIFNYLYPDSEVIRLFTITVTNEVTPTADMQCESLQDPRGYYYVFPGGSTNAENRVSSTYTAGTDPSASWTSNTVTTTWS